MHIKEKLLTAIRAMADIQSLCKLSLGIAIKLLNLTTVPFLMYGLIMIWEHLWENNLKMLGVKVIHLKTALRNTH
jgi:hypothetical protein